MTLRLLLRTPLVVFCLIYAFTSPFPIGRESAASPVYIAVEPFGWVPYPVQSQGLRVGIAAASDGTGQDAYEAAYSTAKTKVLMANVEFSEMMFTRQFALWSSDLVYWAPAIGQRSVKLSYSVFVDDSTESLAVDESSTMLAAGLTCGVKSALASGFLIGAELFGVSSAVMRLSQRGEFPGNAREFEDNPNDYPIVEQAIGTNYRLMRLYLGYVF